MLLILLKMAYVNDTINIIILFTAFGLAIAAIVCGSIDLKRIKKGLHRSKVFKSFDITGIVIGSIIFLLVTTFMLGEIIVPH